MKDTSIERAVLGTVLLEKNAHLTVLRLLKEYDFVDGKMLAVFLAIKRLAHRAEPIDLLTVTAELRRCGELHDIGGAAFVMRLSDGVCSGANLKTHCAILRQYTIRRKLSELGEELMVKSHTTDPLLLHAQTLTHLSDLTAAFQSDGVKPLMEYMTEAVRSYHDARDAGGRLYGLSTGFPTLDMSLGGLKGLVYLAARPSMGKTSLSLQIAKNAAKQGHTVLFVSLETSGEQLAMRQLSADAEINGKFIQTGQGDQFTDTQIKRIIYELDDLKIFVHVVGTITPLQLFGLVRQLKQEHGLGLLIIDFVGLMSSDNSTGSREQEISSISRGLKRIAQDENLPILALSQLSRATVTRGGDKRPQLSDLRDSGSLEQDADQVIFINRPEYYGQNEFQTKDGSVVSSSGLAVIDIAKNKFGPVDEVLLRFEPRFTKFLSM